MDCRDCDCFDKYDGCVCMTECPNKPKVNFVNCEDCDCFDDGLGCICMTKCPKA